MNNNKKRVWVLTGLLIGIGLVVSVGVHFLSPAMNNLVKLVFLGMALIAFGISIGVKMKKTYVIKNKFQWRVWVIIGVIGVPFLAFVVAPLLLVPKMVVEGVLRGMTLIALGVFIGAVMKYKAEID